MKLGNVEYKNGLFLAPMAGVTDMAFRRMCKKYGADGVTTEMISSKALVFGDKKTYELAKIYDGERPCAIQLFGSESATVTRAARIALERFSPDTIDINMGCPVHKVVSSGDGCALMKNPELAYEILKSVVDEVGKDVPVTVKIRKGFDKTSINAVEIALLAQKAGVSAVYIHGRTREQMYAPSVDLEIIRDVKRALSIPVIGNGDILGVHDAEKMLDYTGCDGVMIGRGALGNMYIFYELSQKFEKGIEVKKQTNAAKLSDIITHLSYMKENKGEYIASHEARKHVAWYIKGMRNAAEMRNIINKAETIEEITDIVKKYFMSI